MTILDCQPDGRSANLSKFARYNATQMRVPYNRPWMVQYRDHAYPCEIRLMRCFPKPAIMCYVAYAFRIPECWGRFSQSSCGFYHISQRAPWLANPRRQTQMGAIDMTKETKKNQDEITKAGAVEIEESDLDNVQGGGFNDYLKVPPVGGKGFKVQKFEEIDFDYSKKTLNHIKIKY
ncbi:hypothetical protein [Novosphingobium sp. PC22D]|uniref:hypothetical protein n=1 Tax=Novosphingobium sp. PC22D TaxID=1962403 RepID=UPI001145DDCC|nr:hypothetical protein [Novosphingobium sp. PC22D]